MALCDCILTPIVTIYSYFMFFLVHFVILLLQCIYGVIFIWMWPCFPVTYKMGFGYFQHICTLVLFVLNPFWSVRVIKQPGQKKKLPKIPGGIILMPNHLCYVDPFVIGYGIFPRHFCFVGQGSIFNIPIFGWVLRISGHIPVWFYKDKNDGDKWKVKNRDALLQTSRKYLNQGRRLIVFPEGQLSKTGELREFKMGYFSIAKETGAPILPMAMWGNHRLYPPGGACATMRTGTVEMTFGDLIDPGNFETPEALRDHVRDTIQILLETIPSYRKHFKLDDKPSSVITV